MNFTDANEGDKEYFRELFEVAYTDVIDDQFGNWTTDQYEKLFQTLWDNHSFRKIYIDEVLVGGFWVDKNLEYWQIKEIQIEPRYQGRGIGTRVLQGIMEDAESARKELRLRVLQKNKAIRLYRRLGFRQIDQDDRFFYFTYNT